MGTRDWNKGPEHVKRMLWTTFPVFLFLILPAKGKPLMFKQHKAYKGMLQCILLYTSLLTHCWFCLYGHIFSYVFIVYRHGNYTYKKNIRKLITVSCISLAAEAPGQQDVGNCLPATFLETLSNKILYFTEHLKNCWKGLNVNYYVHFQRHI